MKLIITFLFQMLLLANVALAQQASYRSALIIGVGEYGYSGATPLHGV